MSDFFWFSDAQWARIASLLPTDTRGMARVDDRRVLSGIVHALRNGGRWADCATGWQNAEPWPSSHKTVYRQRNIIKRMSCRLKNWHRIPTRFDRNIKNFIAAIVLGAAVIWWPKRVRTLVALLP